MWLWFGILANISTAWDLFWNSRDTWEISRVFFRRIIWNGQVKGPRNPSNGMDSLKTFSTHSFSFDHQHILHYKIDFFPPFIFAVNVYIIECLHLVFVILPIVPAVPSLWHQQGDEVALSEAQKGAVVSSGVGENGLYARTSVLLQTSRHGTWPGQSSCLS